MKIVHRDLKPSNILFDDEDNAYLSDFGIARLVEATQTVTLIGTPQYMSPEQAHGHGIDARTDVYQIGVVLFEMLTGQIPFTGPTPAAYIHQHAFAPVPILRDYRNGIPADCELIIKCALAKNKDKRFATAGELASALTAVTQGNPLPNSLIPPAEVRPSIHDNSPTKPEADSFKLSITPDKLD